MGFFKSIGKTFSRVATAVVTSGASELARKVAPPVAPILQSLYAPTSLKQAVPVITSAVTLNPLPLVASVGSQIARASMPQQPQGGQPMAFNVGQFLGGVSNAFGGSSNPYLSGFGQVAGLASGFVPQPVSRPVSYPSSGGGQVYTVANKQNTAVATQGMTKEIFDAASKLLARLGIPVKSAATFIPAVKRALSSIAALARRTPAGSIVNLLIGLGLTAMEANTLIAWQAQRRKRRRMNPANSKALRRAARRIKSFHKLCQHTDLIKTHRRSPAFGRKCGTCRKSPCSC